MKLTYAPAAQAARLDPILAAPPPFSAPQTVAAARQAVQEQAAAAAQVQSLTARVQELERLVHRLAACAVQQGPDGSLYLPAGHRLDIDTGNVRLTMSLDAFTVAVNGRVEIALRTAGTPTMPPAGAASVQSLQQAAAPGSWQSVAAAGGVDNPRALPAGTRIP